MTRNPSILIVGGGASGALVAANILRQSTSTDVVMIEPRAELGRGMAYSTTCPLHLLNVPAARMSAFSGDTRHFLRWLAARGYAQYGAGSFVPRMIYGDYLSDILTGAANLAGAWRFRHIRRKAAGFSQDASGIHVHLADGTSVEGDELVLALGNAAPAPWPGISSEAAASGRFFGVAWDPSALKPEDPDEPVLLLGTGLTAVDAVLGLRWNGHRGPLFMVSRRGLVPQAHEGFSGEPALFRETVTARGLLRNLRASTGENWRCAVDAVRPHTNRIWQTLDVSEQRRFLRHVRPYWDVHRHRMAPEIAATLRQLTREGTLRVMAGRLGEIEALTGGLRVPVHLRGSVDKMNLAIGRIVNCTGPESNLARLGSPLVDDLLRQGRLQSHPLRTGALVDNEGSLLDRSGSPSTRLFAMGPLRMGTLIETVAIPEIREQARDLAERLQAAIAAPVSDFEFATAS